MNSHDYGEDAYQLLADLMVTIRRIVRRGLEKASGKEWYLDGLPEGLFERLVARKERETAIDRFNREYQELITFASLDDLAAIIEYNDGLRKLLAGLESDGAPMIDRLREIESLRLKLAASVPFEEDEIETLARYHQEFRDSLTRKKQGSDDQTPQPSVRPKQPPPPHAARSEPEEPPPGASEAAEETPPPSETTAEEAIPRGREFSTQAATFEELVDVVGGVRPDDADSKSVSDLDGGASPSSSMDDARETAAELVAAAVGADAYTTASVERRAVDREAPVEQPTVLDAERAMAADDDREVLALLHREITVVADRAFNGGLDSEYPVWEAVRSSGWFDLKKSDLALAPLELFYQLADQAREAQDEGMELEAVQDMLRESGFSNVLLSLREIFMRHTARK